MSHVDRGQPVVSNGRIWPLNPAYRWNLYLCRIFVVHCLRCISIKQYLADDATYSRSGEFSSTINACFLSLCHWFDGGGGVAQLAPTVRWSATRHTSECKIFTIAHEGVQTPIMKDVKTRGMWDYNWPDILSFSRHTDNVCASYFSSSSYRQAEASISSFVNFCNVVFCVKSLDNSHLIFAVL